MFDNDTPGEHPAGLTDINIEFNDLYTATDEQA